MRQQHGVVRELRDRYDSLTAREQEVMQQVISGLLNKQIAAELHITEFTVKIHRGHVMQKMCADSLADLVRMAETLGIRPRRDSPGAGGPKSCRPGAYGRTSAWREEPAIQPRWCVRLSSFSCRPLV